MDEVLDDLWKMVSPKHLICSSIIWARVSWSRHASVEWLIGHMM